MKFVERSLQDVRRIVVKVGSNLLRGEEQGLNLELIDHLAFNSPESGKQKRS